MEFLLICPPVIVVLAAVILTFKLRKTNKPEKISLIFSIVALVFGIAFIVFSFFPPEYNGEQGLDYVGQALAWAMIVNSIMTSLLVAYFSFAVASTIYAIKAFKDREKRKKGLISLVAAWICGIFFACMFTVNIISDTNTKKSLKVEVQSVTLATDSEGKTAAVVTLEFYNGSKRDITFLSSVHEKVTQYDLEIYYSPVLELLDDPDNDIKAVKPGESVVIRTSYRLNDADGPIRVSCTSYDGKVVYVDSEFQPK